ncbi:MAG: YqgE/AlgH family protein [Alphaproteobacteria bacterium]|nr:YqgE/AlgH family protein [Alphaproteobacteria bacterium]
MASHRDSLLAPGSGGSTRGRPRVCLPNHNGNRRPRCMRLAEFARALTIACLLLAPGGAAPLAGDARSLAGQFLVASREMSDPRFVKTVILIVRHDRAGAFGLVVNRVMAVRPLSQVMRGFGLVPGKAAGEAPVHFGGPVEIERPFFLHSVDYLGPHSYAFAADLALSPDPSVLTRFAEGQAPTRVLVLLGYAGWAPGQLEQELSENSWVVVPADAVLVFDRRNDTKWERAIARHRIDL